MAVFVDKSGELVSLPYNLTLGFARFLALNNITRLRRYTIGRVYRQNPTGGHPREVYECDFDVVTSANVADVAPDAEVCIPPSQLL